jgi:Arc/MetJ family transcription regulator
MLRRTTIELDEDLLKHAQERLGCTTMRATVETALRKAVADADADDAARVERQMAHFRNLHKYADLDVLASEEMWR